MTQSLSVIMIEREQFLRITKNGVVRGKSGMACVTHHDQMVTLELKLAMKVTADKEGAGPPRFVV